MNENGIDAQVWATSPAPPPAKRDDPIVELNKIRLELTDINRRIQQSQDRYNGRLPGPSMPYEQYTKAMQRKEWLGRRIRELELQCSIARAVRREAANKDEVLRAQAVKATLATTFMDMAKEMLADPVYQRIFVAAVHRFDETKESE